MQQRLNELPATIWVLVGSGVFYLLYHILVQRRAPPPKTPALIKPGAGDWPVLGSLRFFSDRQRFMLGHIAESISGNFSFYFGKHHIVGLAGSEGKKTFFESKHLDFGQGCVNPSLTSKSKIVCPTDFVRKTVTPSSSQALPD